METRRATARRRYSARQSEDLGPDAQRRQLCAAVLDDPARIVDVSWHTVRGRFEIAPHHHHDVLQLDLIQQCEGSATVDDREVPITGSTLMASAAGRLHGYSLRPASGDAAVWLIKLRNPSPPRGPDDRQREDMFPPVLTGLPTQTDLRRELDTFIQGWTPQGVGLQALVSLVQVVGTWPTTAAVGLATTPEAPTLEPGNGPSARVRAAVERLGRRTADPPDLAELAEAAHLSPRHFARRFKQDYGSTPHEYLQARRLDVARGLLRDAERRVASVASELGFSSPAAFSRWFTRLAGRSPRAFRQDPKNY